MLPTTVTVNYNGTAYALRRTKESDYKSEYFFRSATLDLVLQIGHTLPNNIGNGESHIVTLHAKTYDAEGVLTKHERLYERLVTDQGKQDSTTLGYLDAALRDFINSNVDAIMDRAS